jgi:uncharacterized protein YggE
MTITVTRRSLPLLALAALGILVAYVLGTSRTSVAQAAVGLPAAIPRVVPAASSGTTASSGITVTGTGKVTGTPDTLRLSLAISTTADNIDDALRAANARMADVQKSLRDHGVKAEDLQTSGLSIQPNYTSSGTPSGYAVSENLTAVVHDLGKAGATLSAAVDAGGNAVRIDGVSVALDDSSGLMGGARAAAITDARTKAEQYAAAAGRQLGPVESISEDTVSSPSPMYDARTASVAGAVPIQAGTQDVSVQVTVVFAVA